MYLLYNLMSRVNEIRGNAKGTTLHEINKGRFRGMSVALPRKPLVIEFARITDDIFQQILCLKRSIKYLETAHDLLLLRLMNGEITV